MLPRCPRGRGKWNNMGRAERIGGEAAGSSGPGLRPVVWPTGFARGLKNRRETWEPAFPGRKGPPTELQLDAVDELGGPGANRARRPESASAPRNSHLLP